MAIVIVGASLAGLRAAQGVRAGGWDGDVIVIGDEPHAPYTRPPLSKELLAGEHEPAQCDFGSADVDVEWRLGETAVGLADHRVRLASGEEVPYERVVLATGCRAREWPAAAATAPAATSPAPGRRVFTLRDLDDALALRDAIRPGIHVAVIGAGFVGCEVAATARKRGAEVTLIDVAPRPLMPLGRELGERCARLHAEHGVQLRLGADPDEGARVEADVVVAALGAIPNTDWLADSALTLHRGGILCDATLSAAPDVLVAGDVAAWPHPLAGGEIVRVEHWTNAAEQGAHAGRNAVLDPGERTPYEAVPYFWTDQYDVKIQSVGFPALADRVEIVEEEDGRLVAVGVRGESVVAVLTWKAPRRLMVHRRALAQQPTLTELLAQIDADEKALGRPQGVTG